jgi:hypothetical protein
MHLFIILKKFYEIDSKYLLQSNIFAIFSNKIFFLAQSKHIVVCLPSLKCLHSEKNININIFDVRITDQSKK